METAVPTIRPSTSKAKAARQDEHNALGTGVGVIYGILAIALTLFATETIAGHPHGQWWAVVSNWPVNAFELTASVLCLARARLERVDRTVALVLGMGLLAWSLGDVSWSLETSGGGVPPTPSVADGFYLAFYPLAYVGLTLLMRGQLGRIPLSRWLDGLVAGTGAAAVSAAFAFDTILRFAGRPAAEFVTNLAYPIADLALLALAVGGLAMVPSWRNRRWLCLVVACVLVAVGDTIYLYQSSLGTYVPGTLLDATWPASLLLMSLAIWQPATPTRERSRRPSAHLLALPGAATLASVAVLAADSIWHVSRVAVALAVISVLGAGLRSLLTMLELRTLTDQHRRQALTDELTGLGNRRHLLHALDDFFSERTPPASADRRAALLLIDLDHFKEINDSFGHPVGDQILVLLGPRLKSVMRSSDVLARLGGDEFGVLLTGADADYATTIAERLTTCIEEPFLLDVAKLHVSVSIGIALAPTHAGDGAGLLRCADVAMYRAKAARSPFEMYQAVIDGGPNRLKLIEQLRESVAHKGFELHFQPQYDLVTGEMLALEALVRWPHPELGLLLPADFLPLAEEMNLMGPLTDLVLESALSQCAAWRATGRKVNVAVNLSATNLLDDGLPNRIRFLLARHRLGADSLVLEVTETTMMSDREKSQEVIQRLQQLGLTVSVDDFGTGFSSLAYLSDLAVGELKIDRELTSRLASGEDQRVAAVVKATIQLGHSLGLRIVAEGVEDGQTYAMLGALGCDLAQGYYMCRPVPASQLNFGRINSGPRLNVLAPPADLVKTRPGA